MQLGFLTEYTPERVEKAAELGFDCLSINSHPTNATGKALATKTGRREVARDFESNGVRISAACAYANYLDPNARNRAASASWLKKVIGFAAEMEVPVVPVLCGRDPELSLDDNIPVVKKVWTPLAKYASDRGIKLAMENWMGGLSIERGINTAVGPYAWRRIFEAVPNEALGLEFDASHLFWQGIDHIRALEEFADRVYHVHLKDTELLYEKQYELGVTGGAFRFRIPGFGELDWPEFFSKLFEIGYDGGCVIEHEDEVFSDDDFDEGLRLGINFLRPMFPKDR